MATHCSLLAWRIPWTEEFGGLSVLGSQWAGQDCLTNTHTQLISCLSPVSSVSQSHTHCCCVCGAYVTWPLMPRDVWLPIAPVEALHRFHPTLQWTASQSSLCIHVRRFLFSIYPEKFCRTRTIPTLSLTGCNLEYSPECLTLAILQPAMQ